MEASPQAAVPPSRERILRELIQAAVRPPSVLVISGETGIGKTHLVDRLLGDPALDVPTRLRSCCPELHDPLPLMPVLEALSAWSPPAHTLLPPVTGALRPLLPELGHHLPPSAAELPDAGDTASRRMRALRALLDSMGPTILVLEDIQWADRSTTDLLRLLFARPPQALTLVLTHRDDPRHADALRGLLSRSTSASLHRTDHRVAPLDTTEVAELARRRLDRRTLTQDFIAALHRDTAGIPGDVEAVLGHLDTSSAPPATQFGVPDLVRGRILAALQGLEADARTIVEAAAVARTPATVRHLAALTGLPRPAVERACESARRHALLYLDETSTYRLRHPLAQQAVYQGMPVHRRRALHLRAARALIAHQQRGLPLDQLAWHYQHGGHTTHWLRYAEAAADHATQQADHDAAAELLLDAVQSAPTRRLRIRLAVKLGHADLHARSSHQAIDILRHVLDTDHPDTAARGELRLLLGILMSQHSPGATGLDEIAAAIPDLTTRPELVARATAVLALPHTTGQPLAKHLAWMAQADQLAPHAPDPALRLAIAAHHASALMFTADPRARQTADDLPDTAETPGEKLAIARGNADLAHAATLLGHPHLARTYLHRAHRALGHMRTRHTGHTESAQLLLDWHSGTWDGLDRRAAAVAADYTDIPALTAEALLVQGAHVLATQGNLNEARRLLQRVIAITRYDTSIVLPASAALIARIESSAGRFAQAVETTEPVLTHLRRTGAWMWAMTVVTVTVEALVRDGRTAAAADLVKEFADGITDRDAPAAQAALTTSRAVLANAERRPREAAAAYEHAARAWRRIQRPYDTARAIEAQGACLLSLGDPAGQPTLMQALDAYTDLGAAWDTARARRTLRDHGIILNHRRGPRGYGSALSPREREVASLAATGHSNRQIAEALQLSPRTVEQHIAKALSKLNLRSRNDLPIA
ncbi:ATP-binding protein [Streptomyces sp. NPDC056670]|uniref:ATP-binding protein n=1 Tax=Streptomyces sp. NPDC056670 TaxID=3345904 RepID=UPI0036778250